jgi:hypothetical protein
VLVPVPVVRNRRSLWSAAAEVEFVVGVAAVAEEMDLDGVIGIPPRMLVVFMSGVGVVVVVVVFSDVEVEVVVVG